MKAPTLENKRVKLTLLDLSNYHYISEISKEDKLVQYSPSPIHTDEDLKTYVDIAVEGFYNRTTLPFIIYDKEKDKYAGSTRFAFMNWHDKVVHIGWTWIGKEFQGTGLNTKMKFLMLQYAFETLKFERVSTFMN
mgnify:FL=1